MEHLFHQKFLTILALLLVVASNTMAQDAAGRTESDSLYNRWSVEGGAGFTRAAKPFSEGYYSSATGVANFGQLRHFEFGVRYMLSTRIGLKLDAAVDKITNIKGSGSLPFDTRMARLGIQGVANVGQILDFSDFTDRLGLLGHAGLQFASLSPKLGDNSGKTEYNGGLILGLTPQFKLSKHFALWVDVSMLSNYRQHLNWDGEYADPSNNLTGQLINISGGLTWYIGKLSQHADWFTKPAIIMAVDAQSRQRLDDIETMLSDADKDGVADYLDVQNNTPAGLKVDSKGHFIDDNKNGIADELETRRDIASRRDSKDNLVGTGDPVLSLIQQGYVNIFFATNKDLPDSGSMNNILYIVNFLKERPALKATLSGFADISGNEKYNRDLSERRAKNIEKLLLSSGIESNRINIVGSGEDKRYPSDSKTSMGLARRVSITIE